MIVIPCLCSALALSQANTFTVQVGGTFDSNCGKAYAASAAAACNFVSKMNGGKGLAIGPNKDYFLKFNFSYDLYPVNEYFTNDQGYKLAKARFAKSHRWRGRWMQPSPWTQHDAHCWWHG
jgi:hypothetical protein